MKTTLFLSVWILLFSSTSFAQEEFSFELYFEDAVGNRDTLVLGYDENATDTIDSGFLEIDISGSIWNNTFEVRAMTR